MFAMSRARIIIADRSELFARGVMQQLIEHGYEVAGVAGTAEEALRLALGNPDSLMLIDEAIGSDGATAFIKNLIAASPGHSTIVLNGSWDLSESVVGIAAGASGVIDKTCTPELLFAAIDIVSGGGMVFSSEAVTVLRDQLGEVFELVAQRTMRRLALTAREIEILQLLPTSMTQSQMAGRLSVSLKTVQNNLSSLYRKLEAGGRAEAVARAIELGLIPPPSARDWGSSGDKAR
jgi:DNA-binding NarL/FixJ family response regulator